jgi:hypothetical protein
MGSARRQSKDHACAATELESRIIALFSAIFRRETRGLSVLMHTGCAGAPALRFAIGTDFPNWIAGGDSASSEGSENEKCREAQKGRLGFSCYAGTVYGWLMVTENFW